MTNGLWEKKFAENIARDRRNIDQLKPVGWRVLVVWESFRPNDVGAMDFVHDQLATGRKIGVLTVVDTFSRYVPVLDARFSYRGENVVATLGHVCRRIG